VADTKYVSATGVRIFARPLYGCTSDKRALGGNENSPGNRCALPVQWRWFVAVTKGVVWSASGIPHILTHPAPGYHLITERGVAAECALPLADCTF